jgi:hypothetical protein
MVRQIVKAYVGGATLSPEELESVMSIQEAAIHEMQQYLLKARKPRGPQVKADEFFDPLREFGHHRFPLLEGLLDGVDVLEIAAGPTPWLSLLEYPVRSVTLEEPHFTMQTQEAVKEYTIPVDDRDALSFLLDQPDASAVVVSKGFSWDLFGLGVIDFQFDTDYFCFVAREIARITPVGKPTLHVSFNDSYLAMAGFEPTNIQWIYRRSDQRI